MTATETLLFGGALFFAGRGEHTQHKPRRKTSRALAAALAATGTLVFVSPAQADTIHVPRDFATIQAAIDAAVDLDEVIVAPGEYVETIDFNGKTIVVRSSDGRDVTTIDGNDAGTVVTCASGEGLGTVLDGFTITNGYALHGAGMRNVNSSPTVTNCTLIDNWADGGTSFGGGVFNDNSSATFTGCTFTSNFARADGAGMYNVNSDVTMLDCRFSYNCAGNFSGGGCYSVQSDLVFVGCEFTGNVAWSFGGAMMIDGGSVIMDRCDFRDNEVNYTGGAILILSGTSALMTNCLFVNNAATDGAPSHCGALADAGDTTIVNCTFADNRAPLTGFCSTMWIASTTVVSNCIIDDDDFNPICGSGSISFSLVTDGWEGEGNIQGDPLFVDRDKGDFRLGPGSPCIDAGSNAAVPRGVTLDLDDNPRFLDDFDVADTGVGRPPIVDMGAYEHLPLAPADLNNDGVVDGGDLLVLLGSWGPCAVCADCIADLDGDCLVGPSDLIILLGSWGDTR